MSAPDGGASTEPGAGSDQSQPGASSTAMPPAGFVSQAELEKERQRARSFQSAADQANARADAIASEVRELKGLMSTFDPNQIVRQVQAGISQAQAIESEKARLRDEFPHARAELYEGSFATPEELRAAIQQSHQAEEERIAQIRQQVTSELAADLKAKHGIELAPASPPPDSAGKGEITLQDFAAMPMSQRLSLDPEVFERLSRMES